MDPFPCLAPQSNLGEHLSFVSHPKNCLGKRSVSQTCVWEEKQEIQAPEKECGLPLGTGVTPSIWDPVF